MEPVDSVAVYGDGCYKGLWEIAIRKQQHMENQQETELFRKCPEISLKIPHFDFGNGMYGNVTSLEQAVFQNDRKHAGRNLIQTLAAIFIL